MPFLVTIVRHGETFMNSQKLLQGHSDAALSETGEEQARKLGKAISTTKFTKAYSSDLQRAFNTAAIILGQLNTPVPDVVKDGRLRERGFGDAEGRPSKEFMERAAKANVNVNDFVPPGAESQEELSKRVADFFDELCALSATSISDENILVVSHGGWINGLMRYLNAQNNIKYTLTNFSPSKAIRIHSNTGATIISISPSTENNISSPAKYVVDFIKVNDVTHLNPTD